MRLVISMLFVLYQYGILPVLLGNMWMSKGKTYSFAKIYVYGYSTLFAIFEILAVVVQYSGKGIYNLSEIWHVVCIFLTVISVIWMLVRYKLTLEGVKVIFKNMRYLTIMHPMLLIGFSIVTLLAAVFVMYSRQDATSEIVSIALDTNTTYAYEPYTKSEYMELPNDKKYSPLEMVYATTVYITGMNCNMLLHTILPFFLIPLFFCASWMFARYLYGDKILQCEKFMVFILIFYSIAWYTNVVPAFGVLQNAWNPMSLFVAYSFPTILLCSFQMLDRFESKKYGIGKEIIFFLVAVIAAQLMFEKAIVITGMICFCCIIIYFVRRGLVHGIITGKYKK